MEIYLAKTQGFCAGVAFAIDIVEKALKKYGAPLYVYHEIVHNTFVVNDFKDRGVTFVEEIEEVPEGSRIIFSAHGVPPQVVQAAKDRNLRFVDATCPLVTKVHNEALKFSKNEFQTVLIGHRGHQEMKGTQGYVDPDKLHIIESEEDVESLDITNDSKVAYITQTTLSVDDTKGMINKLKDKYQHLHEPPRSDICYATQNRQDAVKELAQFCDIIVICGSPNSSNSNRLKEIGDKFAIESYIIDDVKEIDFEVFRGKKKIGISSGASVPRNIVDDLINGIRHHYPEIKVHEFENPEKNIVFALPNVEAELE